MKIIGTLLSICMIALMASPAYAWFDHHQSSVTEFNSAVITSEAQAGAFTGTNTQLSGVSIDRAGIDDIWSGSRNSMTTGAADATANSAILANTDFGCNTCNQPSRVSRYSETNFGIVSTTNVAQAETGLNVQQSGVTVERAHVDDIRSYDSNRLTSGDASATANSLTLVNVEWSWMH